MATLIGGVDPEKEFLWDAFASYFNNPLMFYSETDSRADGEHSVHVCRIHSLLLNENRYLIVMCKRDHFVPATGAPTPLRDLHWHVLQTRHVQQPEKYAFVPQAHRYNLNAPNSILTSERVVRVESNREWSRYQSDRFPQLTVFLLHQRQAPDEYAQRGSISLAVETYRTIVQLEDTDYSNYIHVPPQFRHYSIL